MQSYRHISVQVIKPLCVQMQYNTAEFPFSDFCSCTIDAGNANTIRAPVLKIRCPKNIFYESFRVYLKGGMGRRTLFHTKDKGVVGRTWTKSARQIRILQKDASLEDKGYRINEVFASEHGKWWSEIHIYPVYPKIRL